MKIKDCPFCGGKPEFRQWDFDARIDVVCTKCPCAMWELETEQEAIKAWNTRVPCGQGCEYSGD